MLPIGRQVGVMISDDQLRQERGVPNSVGAVHPAEMVAVMFFDEHGRGHKTVMLRVGSELYHAPNGEQWSASLRSAAPWLKEKVMKELDVDKIPVPAEDSVDIVAQQSAEEMSGDEVSSTP